LLVAAVILVSCVGLVIALRGSGLKSRIIRHFFIAEYGLTKPVVRFRPHPINGEHDVSATGPITVTIIVRNGKLDPKSMPRARVTLATAAGAAVPFAVKPIGDDLMMVRPKVTLSPDTSYMFSLAGLKTMAGATVPTLTTHFTTGRPPDPEIRFRKYALNATEGYASTAVVMGPGHQLYAGTDEGLILRFPIRADGRLGTPQKITSLQNAEGRPRLLIGFCFDPAATEANPIMWVSHGYHAFANAPDFTGKITRLSGPNLERVEDIVINLPRSTRDHLNNQPSIGPDGALYVPQGSNTAYGAPDVAWDYRPQHMLCASILRLDLKRVTPGQPIDVRTVDAGGTYDPRSADAPLTVYATGLRLSYDMVWTASGELYTAVNGSMAGGNTPAGNGVPALTAIPDDENDWLFHVTPGKYYGHPNAHWNHFVLNGGNPDGGSGSLIVSQYPLGTRPDPAWQPPIYDLGPHVSANGMIEYLSDTFGGKLKHALLVCRYNAGSDVIAVKLDGPDHVEHALAGIPGLTDLVAPLDLTEDRTNGNLYVSEYGAKHITLMRPVTADGN
jgi:glucose/arabinose dehydrogenase